MTKIEIECCEGNEQYPGQCLRSRCPAYLKSQKDINGNWPYVGTGYGNLYGNPTHDDYLAEVKRIEDPTKDLRDLGILGDTEEGRSSDWLPTDRNVI